MAERVAKGTTKKDIKKLTGWIKIQKSLVKYAKKFGKSLSLIGPGVSLLVFAQEARASGVGKAALKATPVLGDVVGIIEDYEEFKEELDKASRGAEEGMNADIIHAMNKTREQFRALVDYELKNRPCPNPDPEKIQEALNDLWYGLFRAYRAEKQVSFRPKGLGLSGDVVIQEGKTANITPIVLQFQKALDAACNCYQPGSQDAPRKPAI